MHFFNTGITQTLEGASWPVSRLTYWFRLVFFALFLAAILTYFPSLAHAQEAVCAEVKIEIKQKVNLERQGFDAVMRINNGLDGVALQNISVTVKFTDATGTSVRATSDPTDTTATFFIRLDTLSGINAVDGTGVVAPKTSGEIHWLIVPTSGAGGILPQGKLYNVGATLNYKLGADDKVVEVTPDTITVKPQPLLVLDYFLANEVYADDPFTAPVEPSEPFTLGVRIKNVGGGLAKNTKIESAQPKIVENRQGLLIGFNIADSYVNDQPADKTLLVNFGDIGAGTAKMARWNMLTTLMGNFVEFNAEYTHADSLGGALTSLIKTVAAHLLVRDVKVDIPGRDSIRDFLALDGNTLRVYESEGTETEVMNASATAQLVAAGAGQYNLSFPATTGLVYAKLPDPNNGTVPPGPVTRSDGKLIPAENVWLSKTRNQNLSVSHFINFFDANTTGKYNLQSQGNGQFGSLAGSVYVDGNGNGQKDLNETGLGATSVTLSGVTDGGVSVNTIAYAEPDGTFRFVQLAPGTYSLKVGTVSSYIDGFHLPGSAAGLVSGDAISTIKLPAGANAIGYLFAKRLAPVSSVQADLGIVQTASATTVPVGSNVTLTLKVVNAGPALASSVIVTDQLPAGLSLVSATASAGTYTSASAKWQIGDLAKDATAILTLVAKVNTSGSLTNTATVASTIADPVTNNNSSSVTINSQTEVLPLDLRVAVVAGELHNAIGELVDVAVDVSNFGPNAIGGVILSVPLDANFGLVSATPSVGSFVNDSWMLGELPSGAAATLRLRGKPVGVSVISASTLASSNLNPTYTGDVRLNASSVHADLGLELSANVSQIPLNGEVILNYKVTNNGLVGANDVVVDLGIPAGLTIVSTQAPFGTVQANQWKIFGLFKGSSTTLQVTARINAADSITLLSKVSASGVDPSPANNASRLTLNGSPRAADLVVAQSVDTNKPVFGSTITLTITVNNAGQAVARDVIVNYSVPQGLALSSIFTPTGAYDANAGVWMLGNMLPNTSATLTLTALVNAAGKIYSDAQGLSSTPDPTFTNNVSHLEISSSGTSNIELNLSQASPNPPAKVLSVTVENFGPNAAKDLVIQLNLESLVVTAAQASTGTYDNIRTWKISNLARNAVATLNLTIEPPATATRATAFVYSLGTLDLTPANDTISTQFGASP